MTEVSYPLCTIMQIPCLVLTGWFAVEWAPSLEWSWILCRGTNKLNSMAFDCIHWGLLSHAYQVRQANYCCPLSVNTSTQVCWTALMFRWFAKLFVMGADNLQSTWQVRANQQSVRYIPLNNSTVARRAPHIFWKSDSYAMRSSSLNLSELS